MKSPKFGEGPSSRVQENWAGHGKGLMVRSRTRPIEDLALTPLSYA